MWPLLMILFPELLENIISEANSDSCAWPGSAWVVEVAETWMAEGYTKLG